MLKVLILHGWHGSDAPHWQSWLAQELVLENCIVAFPQLSDKMAPQKEVWIGEAHRIIDDLRPDVVVCHSLANVLWFHLCSRLNHRVKKLLLCAPPRDLRDYPEVKSFFPVSLPGDLCADEVLMLASNNDPYLTLEEALELSETLGVDMEILHNGGHINVDSGYGEWPFAKEWVLA